jgi:GTP-binding protein TrmE N-terminus
MTLASHQLHHTNSFKQSIIRCTQQINSLSQRRYFQSTLAMQTHSDTIFALSSGSGAATKTGVAVIRISGPHAYHTLEKLLGSTSKLNSTKTSIPPPRQAALRRLVCPDTGDLLDQVLFV